MSRASASILIACALLVWAGCATTAAEPVEDRPSATAAASPVLALRGRFDFGTSTDLALDRQGHRHVVATSASGDLWYATDRTGAWVSQRLLAGQDGRIAWAFPSLIADERGRVHVAVVRYYAWDAPSATGGIWYLTDAGRSRGDFGAPTRLAGNMATSPSLRVLDGVRYLAYSRCACAIGQDEAPLFFKTDRSGSWRREKVADFGLEPSLRVGADGRARIAYRARQGVRFTTARTRLGGFATPVRIPGSGGVSGAPSLALGAGGQAQVAWSAYRDPSGPPLAFVAAPIAVAPAVVRDEVLYARRSRDGWTTPRVLGPGRRLELSLDAVGRPHVVIGTTDRVVHRWRGGDGWERRVIADGIQPVSVDIRAFGRRASVAWSQTDLPRGVWVARD
jgi:hypothetical protein